MAALLGSAVVVSIANAGELSQNVQGFSGSDVRGFSGSDVRGFSGSDVRGFSGSDVRGFSGSDVRGFSGSDVRGFSGSDVRGFSGSDAQGFSGSDSNGRGFSGSDARGFSGSDVRGFSGSDVQGFSGSDARGFSGSDSASRFGGAFSVAAMGAVEAVVGNSDSSVTVAGQIFRVSPEDAQIFRVGDYVVAGVIAIGARAIVYHIGMPYVPGVSPVRVKAAVDSVDAAKGTITAGALVVDYTTQLSINPGLELSAGDTVQVVGTQPVPHGQLVVGRAGSDLAATAKRTNRQ